METPIEKIFEMLENNDISNLVEMKEWFLNEQKEFSVSFTKWLIKNCDFQKHGAFNYKGMEFTEKELYELFYTQY